MRGWSIGVIVAVSKRRTASISGRLAVGGRKLARVVQGSLSRHRPIKEGGIHFVIEGRGPMNKAGRG